MTKLSKMGAAFLVCALFTLTSTINLITHSASAATEAYTITSSYSPFRLEMAGRLNVSVGGMTFNANTNMSLRQIAVALVSDQRRPGAAFISQKVSLFDFATASKVGEVFLNNTNADRGIAVFTPPLPLRAFVGRTVGALGDLTGQDANSFERRGMFVALAYDGTSTNQFANYAVAEESGENVFGPKGEVIQLGGGMRIFRNLPTIVTTGRRILPLAGEPAITLEIINPDVTSDLGFKKLSFRIAQSGLKDISFKLYGNGLLANSQAVRETNGVVEVFFDATTLAKLVPADARKTYTLVPDTVVWETSLPEPYLYVELLPDTATSPKVVGTVAQIEACPENTDNIIWTPFTKSAPRASAESELEADWTNGYGLTGPAYVESSYLPKLVGITVQGKTASPEFVTIHIRLNEGEYIPPLRIEWSDNLQTWQKVLQSDLADSRGDRQPDNWSLARLQYRTSGTMRCYRLIIQ